MVNLKKDMTVDEIIQYTAQLEEDLQILKTLLNELGYKDIPIDYEYFRKTQKVLKKDNNEKV